ncbi:hypothetical protein HLB44_09840 [Aquincola sp. S2]|uniref:Inhibitor of vertebrate lysozyme (Ivy) n=1 Tax=Pseudaquabacterium terrae TaxID=2732868 RepID=A0ABX2EF98_9BURK|nr:Ivy family c-type lysozyme inhibitor [Aquabacterium terrae]NRF67284.1 hypothetical protein [Aquabacterium terrae]
MNTPRTASPQYRLLGIALLLLGTAPEAWAQGKIDAKLMQRYGGVLAPDCSNYMLPQLKYLGDSLVVQDAGKALLTGRNVKAVPTYFRGTAPPEFETALTSEVAGGEALVFVLYRNASGVFAAVEGGPKVMAMLPAALKGQRVRHCDPNRNRAPGTAAPIQIGPPDLLKDAKFKRAYVQALGPLAREPWLMTLDGPAPPVETVRVAGTEYQLVSVCKNHDCYDNSMVVLYAAASQKVVGKVFQRGRSTLIGAPPPPIAAELERLWKAAFRK